MTQADAIIDALPFATRAQMYDEGAYDERFWSYASRLLAGERDPKSVAENAMLRAAINEMDPSRFPDTAGEWPVMRARMRQTIELVTQGAIHRALPGPHEPGFLQDFGITPIIQAIAEGAGEAIYERTGQVGLSEFGQWAIIATAINTLAPIGMSYYQRREQLRQQRRQIAAQQAEAQAAQQQAAAILAQQQAAAAAAAKQQQVQQAVAAQRRAAAAVPSGGVPWYFIIGGLVALLGLGYLAFRKRAAP